MELGTGLFLTINVKDIEDRSCGGETGRQLAVPVQSQHPAALTTGLASMERQPSPRRLAQAGMLEALGPADPGSRVEFPTGPGLEGSSPPAQGETRRPGVTGQALPICTFCKQNGESRKIYASHVLKDKNGRTVCPILRRYTCPVCRATGDSAHTKRFCQSLRENYRSTYNKTSRDTNKMQKLFKK
ncbi:nanos homolog 2-like [Hemiscyllium ocellatum]|uniref:nanos homolog 2-like n=1 Tax=Hemiscyllium ocellatum TaxID=170820 RepID=UPI002966B687|nr:nanos homolog 2-like [Hemiscyllium ocellatum]